MLITIAIITLIIFIIIYLRYFKDYINVKNKFRIIEKVLDARDLLVLKILGESKNNENAEMIARLIDERIKEKNLGYTAKMKIDILLNQELKVFYTEMNNIKNNEIIRNVLTNLISLEKKLKIIREEYNMAVAKYNNNLLNNKFISIRLIKMKPLDTYGKKHNKEQVQ